jgi:hypothetical protein
MAQSHVGRRSQLLEDHRFRSRDTLAWGTSIDAPRLTDGFGWHCMCPGTDLLRVVELIKDVIDVSLGRDDYTRAIPVSDSVQATPDKSD